MAVRSAMLPRWSLHDHAWKAVVEDGTHVWHLGDFGHKSDRARLSKVFKQLRGIKHPVRGNHDEEGTTHPDMGWASVQDRKILHADGQSLVCDHYPSREWYGCWRGSVLPQGHTHNNLPPSSRSFDCGADNLGYVPATIGEIRARMETLSHLDFRAGTEVEWLVAPREPREPR